MRRSLTDEDFLTMSKAGKVAGLVFKGIEKIIRPGIVTLDIEKFFDKSLACYPGMTAAFKGFKGYPASICISVNEEIIHGIPSSDKVLKEGDIVGIDLGIKYKGLFVDTAQTFIVGRGTKEARNLLQVTRKSLYEGIKKAEAGLKVGDIGFAVQKVVEASGFSVIRQFVGHGVGEELHLLPEIPNYGNVGEGFELTVGMAIAIEPMVASGNYQVEVLADGWTAKTKDNSLSAHFEHTVAITKKGPWILTK